LQELLARDKNVRDSSKGLRHFNGTFVRASDIQKFVCKKYKSTVGSMDMTLIATLSIGDSMGRLVAQNMATRTIHIGYKALSKETIEEKSNKFEYVLTRKGSSCNAYNIFPFNVSQILDQIFDEKRTKIYGGKAKRYGDNVDYISTSLHKDRTSHVKISQSEPDYLAYGNGEDSSSDEDASEADYSDAFESVDRRSNNLETIDSDKPQRGSQESISDENESDDNLYNDKQSSKKRKVSKSPRKKMKKSGIRRAETSKIKYADWSKERQFESSFEPDMESSEMIKLQRSACVAFINKDYAHVWSQSQSNGR
jgi:hypothetical protein